MQQSIWLHSPLSFRVNKLQQDITCDVCIVGGGLSGVYTAYLLAQAGMDVVLVEALTIAGGATGRATGKLSSQQDILYSKLLNEFSQDEARLYYKCQKQAIEQAMKLANAPTIIPSASTLYATTEMGVKSLQQEYEAYQLLKIPCRLSNDHELPLETKATLTIEDDAQINPVHFTQQLAEQAIKNGAKIFEETRVHELLPEQKMLKTEDGATIQYQKLILCTHYPIESIAKMNMMKLKVERGYLLATKVDEPLLQQYLSVEQPTRSIRTATVNDETYMLLAGSNHLAGSTEDTNPYYKALEIDLVNEFHLTNPAAFKWSSQDAETPDLLPYIGPLTPEQDDPSVYIATGYRKWGLTNSLVAGELLLAHLTNNALADQEKALFSPSRTSFGKTLAQALQIGSIVIGEFVGGHLGRPEAPKCTHLGCKTRWNEADETWDCPCHGSRYRKNGEVLEGPAVYPLKLEED